MINAGFLIAEQRSLPSSIEVCISWKRASAPCFISQLCRRLLHATQIRFSRVHIFKLIFEDVASTHFMNSWLHRVHVIYMVPDFVTDFTSRVSIRARAMLTAYRLSSSPMYTVHGQWIKRCDINHQHDIIIIMLYCANRAVILRYVDLLERWRHTTCIYAKDLTGLPYYSFASVRVWVSCWLVSDVCICDELFPMCHIYGLVSTCSSLGSSMQSSVAYLRNMHWELPTRLGCRSPSIGPDVLVEYLRKENNVDVETVYVFILQSNHLLSPLRPECSVSLILQLQIQQQHNLESSFGPMVLLIAWRVPWHCFARRFSNLQKGLHLTRENLGTKLMRTLSSGTAHTPSV